MSVLILRLLIKLKLVMNMIIVVVLVSLLLGASGLPVCEEDGQRFESESCMKYYECQNGQPVLMECPKNLYWNNETNLCDFWRNVNCLITTEEAESMTLDKPAYIYLTFDDGPGWGTEETLALLDEMDVPGTFCIISTYVDGMDPNGTLTDNQKKLIQVIEAGHMVIDHSYDHMQHNSQGSNEGAYTADIVKEASYFGQRAVDSVLPVLISAGLSTDVIDKVVSDLLSYIRLPYTGQWITESYWYDCLICTIPAESGLYGAQLGEYLHSQNGANLIGWDYEYPQDYFETRYYKDALYSIMALPLHISVQRNKYVILLHDRFQDPGDFWGDYGEENLANLKEFIRLAKKIGYQFRSLETYLTDVPSWD